MGAMFGVRLEGGPGQAPSFPFFHFLALRAYGLWVGGSWTLQTTLLGVSFLRLDPPNVVLFFLLVSLQNKRKRDARKKGHPQVPYQSKPLGEVSRGVVNESCLLRAMRGGLGLAVHRKSLQKKKGHQVRTAGECCISIVPVCAILPTNSIRARDDARVPRRV